MATIPVQFGIEFEAVGPRSWLGFLLGQNAGLDVASDDYGDSSCWTLGEDGSVLDEKPDDNDANPDFKIYNQSSDDLECELRTPILTWSKMGEVKKALDVMSKVCVLSNSCGMHVHVSSPVSAVVNGKKMAQLIEAKYSARSSRKRWCHSGYSVDDKYYVVRKVWEYEWDGNIEEDADRGNNHLEVRVFDGCLDYKEVSKRVRDVIDCYRKASVYRGRDGYGRPLARPVRVRSVGTSGLVVPVRRKLVSV